jgi:hypothetical protein
MHTSRKSRNWWTLESWRSSSVNTAIETYTQAPAWGFHPLDFFWNFGRRFWVMLASPSVQSHLLTLSENPLRTAPSSEMWIRNNVLVRIVVVLLQYDYTSVSSQQQLTCSHTKWSGCNASILHYIARWGQTAMEAPCQFRSVLKTFIHSWRQGRASLDSQASSRPSHRFAGHIGVKESMQLQTTPWSSPNHRARACVVNALRLLL